MKMKEICLLSQSEKRAKWGEGPWVYESDQITWQDNETNLYCFAIRNSEMGTWCGYVAIDNTYSIYENKYDDIDVLIHGGLTYAGNIDELFSAFAEDENLKNLSVFGFDCGHAGDFIPFFKSNILNGVYRNAMFIKQECASLAKQFQKFRCKKTQAIKTKNRISKFTRFENLEM